MTNDKEIRNFCIKRTVKNFGMLGMRAFGTVLVILFFLCVYRVVFLGGQRDAGDTVQNMIFQYHITFTLVIALSMYIDYTRIQMRLVTGFGSMRRETYWGSYVMFSVYAVLAVCLYIVLCGLCGLPFSGSTLYLSVLLLVGAIAQCTAYLQIRTGSRWVFVVVLISVSFFAGVAEVYFEELERVKNILAFGSMVQKSILLIGGIVLFVLASLPIKVYLKK